VAGSPAPFPLFLSLFFFFSDMSRLDFREERKGAAIRNDAYIVIEK